MDDRPQKERNLRDGAESHESPGQCACAVFYAAPVRLSSRFLLLECSQCGALWAVRQGQDPVRLAAADLATLEELDGDDNSETRAS
ncbi:MAG: hypothetical protein J5J06_18180 [Phycisphaerae bacterium]|nr:hypothetical protein [Phycisphaerae bacterium]